MSDSTSIRLTRPRALQLAGKYREGDEPLPATVERIMERYDTMLAHRLPAAPAAPSAPAAEQQPAA